MIFFDNKRKLQLRPSYSDDLQYGEGPSLHELERQIVSYLSLEDEERRQTDVPSVWDAPVPPHFGELLVKANSGKCGFCEQIRSDLKPYRFRPPAYARPSKGSHEKGTYLWLAFNWDNFFPICSDCHPKYPDYFPVKGNRASIPEKEQLDNLLTRQGLQLSEVKQLYYPGELENPFKAFCVRINGRLIHKNVPAQNTIEQFDLNRDTLLQIRGDVFRGVIEDLFQRMSPDEGESKFVSEFSGPIYLLKRTIAEELKKSLGQSGNLSFPKIDFTFAKWQELSDFTDQLNRVLNDMQSAAAADDDPEEMFYSDDFEEVPHHGENITQVRIKNFKSIEDLTLDFPRPSNESSLFSTGETNPASRKPCLLIVGENSTGKSSILEAITLALISHEARNQLFTSPKELILDGEMLGASQWQYDTNAYVDVTFENSKANLGIDSVSGRFVPSTVPFINSRIFAYGASRIYSDKRRTGSIRHVDTLFRSSKAISNPEAFLAKLWYQNPDGLDEVASALRHIIQIDGHFRNISVEPGSNSSSCYINIEKAKPGERPYIVKQKLSVASSGYRAVLSLVCDIFSNLFETPDIPTWEARNQSAIVLIDEVEAHLHPRWKIKIIDGLRKALPNVTFIMTTHDPLCVRGMSAGEVVVLHRYAKPDGTPPWAIPEKIECIANMDGFETMTVEQLLTSDLFRMISTDDPWMEEKFARISDILAREQTGEVFPNERRLLAEFKSEIASTLPFGDSEAANIVHRAVAKYLNGRRYRTLQDDKQALEDVDSAVDRFLRSIVE